MESLLEFSKEIQKAFENYGQIDVKRLKEYESKIRTVTESQVAPIQVKKQKTSLESEEQDSGVNSTTTTTSTQASSTTLATSGSARPSRSAKVAASGNLKLPNLTTKMRQEIKLERISEISSISTSTKISDAKENDLNSINIKREKISVGSNSGDSSILVIPNEVNIISISDDEDDDNKMPPPIMPPPKKLPAKKTRNTKKTSASTESSASESNLLEGNSLQSIDASSSIQPKKTKKGKKSKKTVMPIVVKQEVVEEDVEEAVLPNGKTSENQKTSKKNSSDETNATLESVYEDASDKIPSQPSNGLAVSATYVLPKNLVKENSLTVQASKVGKGKASYSSIITEDDSDDDLPLQVPKTKKNNKELFDPCVQSPMKAKVAAFEKQAQAQYNSPAEPVRQTRTKTRLLAKQKANSDAGSTNSTSKLPKPTTPSVEIRYPMKGHTPSQTTPLGQSAQNLLRTQMQSASASASSTSSTSTSKLGTMGKSASAQPLKIRSRDNSAEDMARAKDAILEKKRKGEERSKRAQMQREAQEREKKEKIEKLMKAKQEREAAREAIKQQKAQEELQKQQKLLEQKREKERQYKAELARAAQLERDLILSKKIADERAYLDSMKQSKKDSPKSVLTFDMLETDDSTDDEETVSRNRSNRPPPPAWSSRANAKREIIMQAGISVSTIDKLFSCKPTTPDLAAIFPEIDSKHLQRNSSAFWSTPPRYSQLPKY